MSLTIESLRDILATRGGTLASGSHSNMPVETCTPCVLELVAIAKLGRVTDSPMECGYPDIRAINDRYRDPQRRTEDLLPWLVALDGWADWSTDRRVAWARIVVLRTVREILPIVLRKKWPTRAEACERAETMGEARAAAAAAADDAYADAAAAADAAAYADAAAADDAAAAAAYTDSAAAAAAEDASYAAYAATATAAAAANAADAAAAAATADDCAHHYILRLAVRIQIEAAQATGGAA